ncbi:signal peptidase I [Flavobacterium eburneipallidum]|uniref:signal peptidase I n=1 Tax=Flavobacterium eburneipallidum TaxID=3003263 RepID=UPI002482C635|nr:signal peptidase I [Flavobacterium eburneipallidum]
MTAFQWFVFFLILQVIHFLGTWKLYEAAGRKRWEAAIPVYNSIVLMKIIGRPTWWTLLLFIPIINLIMFAVIWVETLRSFGKRSYLDTFLGLITFGFYIYYVNYTQKLNYVADRKLNEENQAGSTVSSLLFAIIVATLVHTYVVQPFTIPTSSLEKSLLVGDFLFVSKMNYGPRVPMTTVALPMVHDSIPMTKKKSYLSWPQLPYLRLPAFEKIKNSDIVVFNWPVDTVYQFRDVSGRHIDKPIDKKSNYVKRCVGIPGDSLAIKDGIVYINGKVLALPERAKPQYSYKLVLDGKTPIDFEFLFKDMDVTDGVNYVSPQKDTVGIAALTAESAARFKNILGIKAVIRNVSHQAETGRHGVFPHTTQWNRDNYGPIYIPQAGKSVALNLNSLPFYSYIITEYEKNKLEIKGSDIYINGEKTNTYTFKQDYYWMMGDNRHNSEDSRYWGYVPADHIVGKPVFIWMSWDTNGKGLGKIRWERMFTTVGGDGQPQSYFKIFLILLAVYFVGEYFWNKRKANKA